MKPRRENGATFVSPMTSDVCMDSALMIIPLARVVVQKFPLSVRQVRPGELPESRTALESWISRGFLKPNLAQKVDAAER
jgi:hypothetical protein